MSLFSRIAEGLAGLRGTKGDLTTNFTDMSVSGVKYSGEIEDKSEADYLKAIKGWSYACIAAIADQIAAIDLRLFKYNEDGSSEEIFQSPILDVLYRVNPYTTRFDHFWITQAFLESIGESFWYLEKDEKTQEVINIYFLMPSKVTPVISSDRQIKSYKYQLENETLELPADRVIFIKYPNPSNPFRGLGTMEAAASTIDLDNFSETWNKKFFKNSARPHSLLNVKNANMSKEQIERLKNLLLNHIRVLIKLTEQWFCLVICH
jgi:HK97 family phage portal protein